MNFMDWQAERHEVLAAQAFYMVFFGNGFISNVDKKSARFERGVALNGCPLFNDLRTSEYG